MDTFDASKFLERKFSIDFLDPKIIHDRVLLIQGKKFYVNSVHLSMFSEFFDGLFNSHFREENQTEMELMDVSARDFNNFLRIIYPMDFKISTDNMGGLLMLADRFLSPFIWQKCLRFLDDPKNNIPLKELLQWDRYIPSNAFKPVIAYRLDKKLSEATNLDQVESVLKGGKKFPFENMKDRAENILLRFFNTNKISTDVAHKYLKVATEQDLDELKEHIERCLIQEGNHCTPSEMCHLLSLGQTYDLQLLTDFIREDFVKRALNRKYSKEEVATHLNSLYFKAQIETVMSQVENLLVAFLPRHKCTMEVILINMLEKTDRSLKVLELFLEIAFKNSFDNLKEFVKLTFEQQKAKKRVDEQLEWEHLEGVVDQKILSKFETTHDCTHIEGIVKYNMPLTKAAVEDYLKIGSNALKNQKELAKSMKSSPEFDNFVRQALEKNEKAELLLKHFG